MPAIKGSKKIKVEQFDTKSVMDSVKDLDLDKVINEIGSLQIKTQNTLASLSGELANRIKLLDNVNTAISIKENRLKEMHDIEDMAITIDDMKAMKDQEAKIAAEERAARAKSWAEEEAEYHKSWQRQRDDWAYGVDQEKKKWKDQFEAEVLTNKRNEATRQELLSKSWAEREAVIKSKETEHQDLVKQVQEFDARLKAECARTTAAATKELTNKYDHQIEMLKKDAEAEKKANLISNGAYELTIKGLEEQIRDLKAQLISARTDAKEVATQALQSASGRQVADALQRVVDTRDTQTKSK